MQSRNTKHAACSFLCVCKCLKTWHCIVKFTVICEPESGNKNLSVGWKFNDSGIGSISVIGTN